MSTDELSVLLGRLQQIEHGMSELLLIVLQLQKTQGLPVQEWFSIDEVAAMTGLSDDHIRRHVTAGLLPVTNQGTYDKPYYRIHRRDIDEWMMKRRETPSPA